MRGLAALALAVLATTGSAQETRRNLFCADETGREFEVILWTASAFDLPLHCVLRLGLGVAACAPDGGWGLSEPGLDRIDRIATDAAGLEHDGGWFFARVGPTEFIASASIGARPPLALEISGETFWRLRLTLATGEGSIFTRDGETKVTCDPA